jgi:hypothetical protein
MQSIGPPVHVARPIAPALRGRTTICAALAVLACALACSKSRESGTVAPAADSLATASAAPRAGVIVFSIDPASKTAVDMPGLREHIRADTTGAAGTLEVDPDNLATSRGEVKIDLSTLTMHTFEEGEKNAKQTEHAHTWLEVIVGGKVDEANRWAVFAVRSLDDLSATDLSKIATVPAGGDEVMRVVTATVHGEVLLHGHQVNRDVPVELTFRYPQGAPPSATPRALEVKTRQPMRLVLKEHEIVPRDPIGMALEWSASLVSKVAETADVSVDLKATPSSRVRAAR